VKIFIVIAVLLSYGVFIDNAFCQNNSAFSQNKTFAQQRTSLTEQERSPDFYTDLIVWETEMARQSIDICYNANKASLCNKTYESIGKCKVVAPSVRNKMIQDAEVLADTVLVKALQLRDVNLPMLPSEGYAGAESTCRNVIGYLAETSAEMYLRTAEAYANAKDYNSARRIYRMVIVTYVGDTYKGLVKQAEFGLEGLTNVNLTPDKEQDINKR
jgi:hypothetical protein